MEPFRTSHIAWPRRSTAPTSTPTRSFPSSSSSASSAPATATFSSSTGARRPSGDPDPDFVLNDPRYQGAQILIAGKNFACGSSREHAAWALSATTASARVIAPTFADIFFSNAGKNGIVLVRLSEEQVAPAAPQRANHPRLSTHRLA